MPTLHGVDRRRRRPAPRRRVPAEPSELHRLLEEAFDALPAEERAVILLQLAEERMTLLEWFARRLADHLAGIGRLH